MKPINIFAAALSFAVFAAAPVLAPALAADLGPAVGEPLPHDLSIEGGPAFDDLAGPAGMALFFVRSLDWCPYCQAQAVEVNEAVGDFEARGLSVVIVSYDAADKQAAFAGRHEFEPALVSDPDSEIIDAFGLRNETHKAGRFAGIPHPAVFIVGPDATILAKLYEEDYASNDKSYQERPAIEAILTAADRALESAP